MMGPLRSATDVKKKSTILPKPGASGIDGGMTADAVEKIARSSDWDCDGISDFEDKCSDVPSKNNKDSDGDGSGDVCDKISSDLAVKVTASKKRARVGEKIDFAIVITNYGPNQDAYGIRILDIFPRALRINSVKTTLPDCDEFEGSLLCEGIGPLAVGQSITIAVSATARRVKTIRNTVTVENGIGDLNLKNNRSSVTIKIAR